MGSETDGKSWIFDPNWYIDPDDFQESIEGTYECSYDDVSDDDRWQALAMYKDEAYEDEKANIQALVGDERIIARGTAGLWYGSPEGGFIAQDLQDAIWKCAGRTTGDIGFYADGEGELHMTFAHHDGTHDLTLRAITSEGEDYIDAMEYELAESDIERDVFANGEYSTKIDMLGA